MAPCGSGTLARRERAHWRAAGGRSTAEAWPRCRRRSNFTSFWRILLARCGWERMRPQQSAETALSLSRRCIKGVGERFK